MSNKTQLQSNNAQLAALIQTLQNKVTGGGLPDGLLAIDTGSVTLSAASAQIANVAHGLGVEPDFVAVIFDPATKYKKASGIMAYWGWKGNIYDSSDAVYYDGWHRVISTMNTSYNIGALSSQGTTATDTDFTVQSGSTTYKYQAGTYLWVVGTFK